MAQAQQIRTPYFPSVDIHCGLISTTVINNDIPWTEAIGKLCPLSSNSTFSFFHHLDSVGFSFLDPNIWLALIHPIKKVPYLHLKNKPTSYISVPQTLTDIIRSRIHRTSPTTHPSPLFAQSFPFFIHGSETHYLLAVSTLVLRSVRLRVRDPYSPFSIGCMDPQPTNQPAQSNPTSEILFRFFAKLHIDLKQTLCSFDWPLTTIYPRDFPNPSSIFELRCLLSPHFSLFGGCGCSPRQGLGP